MFGLIGPDGAGKTTAIRLMCGLLKPDGGTVRVLGRDPVKQHLDVTQTLGYLSQRFSLYGDLSIDENISFFAEIHGLSMRDPAIRDRRERLLELTQLAKFRTRLAEQLSGGMKQKLALACTLVHEPQNHSARRADDGRRSRVAARILEAALRISRAGNHDSDGDAVPRRSRAVLARGAAPRRPALALDTPANLRAALPGDRHGGHRGRSGSRDERARAAARESPTCSCSASARTSGSHAGRAVERSAAAHVGAANGRDRRRERPARTRVARRRLHRASREGNSMKRAIRPFFCLCSCGANVAFAQTTPLRLTLDDAIARGIEASHRLEELGARQEAARAD